MKRVGVMGGTFDPIHIGHLAIAEEVRESLRLDAVLFVPAGSPPFKQDRSVTGVGHRVAMVGLAIAGNPAFELSRIEVDRAGLSYTADTVEALAQDGSEVTLILSAETFAELPTWHEPHRILAAANVAVVPRDGYPAPDAAGLAETFPGRAPRVTSLDGPLLRLSSTEIRARVAAGRSIRYLVPPAVEAYIDDHHLYRSLESTAIEPMITDLTTTESRTAST